jgi:hypothetical protein
MIAVEPSDSGFLRKRLFDEKPVRLTGGKGQAREEATQILALLEVN